MEKQFKNKQLFIDKDGDWVYILGYEKSCDTKYYLYTYTSEDRNYIWTLDKISDLDVLKIQPTETQETLKEVNEKLLIDKAIKFLEEDYANHYNIDNFHLYYTQEPEEDSNKGKIYNPFTNTWSWL